MPSYRLPGWSRALRAIFCLLLASGLLSWLGSPARAERSITPPPNLVLEEGQTKPEPMWVVLPYAFDSDTTDWAYGAALGSQGYLQEQAGLLGAVMGSSNGSWGFYLVGWNYQLPWFRRLFFDFNTSVGNYGNQRFYASEPRPAGSVRAGSNDSDEDDYLSGEGNEDWADFTFRYVLPLGAARNDPLSRYRVKEGLLQEGATGGGAWNPLTGGISMVELKPFYRRRTLKRDYGEITRDTSGLMLALTYNNTDFPINPSRGSVQRLALRRDFGLLEHSQPWTTVEAELAGYWDLGKWPWFKQSVLALDFWTVDTPSWDESGGRVSGDPPTYYGGSLGGFWRLRGYPSNRFHDRAAILYTAELRLIPQWQPLAQSRPGLPAWLKFFKIDWWQLVAFAEAGRVAGTWSLSELHSDMKWDLGAGIRLMALKAVVRLDLAYSDEGVGVWAMVGHPF